MPKLNDPNARITRENPLIISPSDSSSRLQYAIVGGVVGVPFILGNAWAAAQGFWPIPVATTLASGGLVAAFRTNARNNRQYQKLSVEGNDLVIDHHRPPGSRQTNHLPYTWARVALVPARPNDRSEEPRQRLLISAREQEVFIGDFLPPNTIPPLRDIIDASLHDLRAHG